MAYYDGNNFKKGLKRRLFFQKREEQTTEIGEIN